MQIQKEEVRTRIYNAAVKEFRKNGYKGTTIRNISKRANVPIGNLYRYYKNKGIIFEDIVDKVYTKLIDIAATPDSIEELDKNMGLNIAGTLGKIIDINADYRDELIILLNGSKESKYDDFKQIISKSLSDRMKCEWQFFVDKGEVLPRDLFIIDVIATGVIESFIMIFNRYDDRDELEYKLKEYTQLTFEDFINRLKSITK